MVYRGSVGRTRNDQYVTMSLTVTPTQVASDATGKCNIFVSTSGLSSVTDWGTLSPNWGEFRVLAMRVDYRPIQPDFAINTPVGFLAEVHSNSFSTPSAPSSLANVPGRSMVSLGRAWSKTWRMSGADEAGFSVTSAAPPSYGGITSATDFGAASTVFGYYTVQFEVQFRSQA